MDKVQRLQKPQASKQTSFGIPKDAEESRDSAAAFRDDINNNGAHSLLSQIPAASNFYAPWSGLGLEARPSISGNIATTMIGGIPSPPPFIDWNEFQHL
jgi:hypothetical protein